MFQEEAGEPCPRPILESLPWGSLLVPPGSGVQGPLPCLFLTLSYQECSRHLASGKNLERVAMAFLLLCSFRLTRYLVGTRVCPNEWIATVYHVGVGAKNGKRDIGNKSFRREGKVRSTATHDMQQLIQTAGATWLSPFSLYGMFGVHPSVTRVDFSEMSPLCPLASPRLITFGNSKPGDSIRTLTRWNCMGSQMALLGYIRLPSPFHLKRIFLT